MSIPNLDLIVQIRTQEKTEPEKLNQPDQKPCSKSPISFLEDLENVFVDSLLTGMEVIIIGDLNCNLHGNCSDDRALSNFCSALNLTQLVKEPTRVTERSQTLIDIVLTTNENIINACKVKSLTISDHSLVYVTVKVKVHKPHCSYITARSYKIYNAHLLTTWVVLHFT